MAGCLAWRKTSADHSLNQPLPLCAGSGMQPYKSATCLYIAHECHFLVAVIKHFIIGVVEYQQCIFLKVVFCENCRIVRNIYIEAVLFS